MLQVQLYSYSKCFLDNTADLRMYMYTCRYMHLQHVVVIVVHEWNLIGIRLMVC